jgi:hypothetical protein
VSGHSPGDKPTDPVDAKLRKCRLRYDDIDPETKALLRQARQILESECGERLTDDAFLRTLARSIIDGACGERTKAMYQVAVVTCEQCKRGWQDGGGITVEMSPAKLEVALCDSQHIGKVDADDAGPDDHTGSVDAEDSGSDDRIGKVDTDDSHVANPYPRGCESQSDVQAARRRATADIPPRVRRAVRARDHGKCRVPWCRSSRNVDQHHIIPKSQGGTHTLGNLLLLCESHHIAHHEGALIIEGTATTAKFTRRAHSAFGIAERAVDTACALKELGFDRHEVKAAMDKARTHVGTSELTLQQWIKIALSYCPKPRA